MTLNTNDGPIVTTESGKRYNADIRKDELLSCPFCGGRPKIQDNGDYEIVMCLNGDCYAQPSIRDRERKSAREVWNTRVLDH